MTATVGKGKEISTANELQFTAEELLMFAVDHIFGRFNHDQEGNVEGMSMRICVIPELKGGKVIMTGSEVVAPFAKMNIDATDIRWIGGDLCMTLTIKTSKDSE